MLRLFQFVVLVLALSLVALASAIVTMRFAIHGAEVKLPSFKGLTAQEAQARAAALGVELTVENRFYSAEVPAGRILTQSPAPGTVVRREWRVRAAESLGPQTVAIPNLAGLEQRAATIQIRRLGLQLGDIARMPYAAAPPDTVIAQDPPPGAAGVETPTIAVVLSDPVASDSTSSAAGYVMPDFTGKPYATAAGAITRGGLKLAPELATTAATNPSQSQIPTPPGTVTAQTPQAGYSIDPNTPVQLTVVR